MLSGCRLVAVHPLMGILTIHGTYVVLTEQRKSDSAQDMIIARSKEQVVILSPYKR